MSKYIVDSNFFIQAHRSIYPLDVVQSFWVKVNELSRNGTIVSIDKVKKEIYDNSSHEDELKIWCEQLKDSVLLFDIDKIMKLLKIFNMSLSS